MAFALTSQARNASALTQHDALATTGTRRGREEEEEEEPEEEDLRPTGKEGWLSKGRLIQTLKHMDGTTGTSKDTGFFLANACGAVHIALFNFRGSLQI